MTTDEIEIDDSLIDVQDYKKLLTAILQQAIDDYVKLQHPKYRKKKYLQEAYLDAIDMLFDPEYRMLHVNNQYGKPMSLADMVSEVMGKEVSDLEKIKEYVIDQTLEYWDAKYIKTINIPETVQIVGHVFRVENIDGEVDLLSIDYKNKIINLHTDLSKTKKEKLFVDAVVEITFYYSDIGIKRADLEKLKKMWFTTLKLNNCFSGID